MSSSTSPPKTAIIVGAGVGGVALAAHLAHAGILVTVVEKNDFTGGRCSLLHSSDNAYRFDQGPSLLLLLDHFKRTFLELGTTLESHIELLKCKPNYVVHFSDGENVRLSTDLVEMKEVMDKYEGPEGMERYMGFLRESGIHSRLAAEHVLEKEFGGYTALLRWGLLKEIMVMHIFESVWTRARCWFRSERLRQVLTFGTMYLGMSPFEALGTYSLLQYTELAEGIWYPRGGFHKVIEALGNIAESKSATLRLSTPVSRVLLTPENRATGVLLETGETLTADLVILNCDLIYAYTHLLPPTPYSLSLPTRRHSCSSISFYWAINKPLPGLAAHNIFLADEFRDSFEDIFTHQSMPADPSFYVNVPSHIDPTASPPGCSAVVVLVPIGHLTDSSTPASLDVLVGRARALVLKNILARTGEEIEGWIVEEKVNTPYTWKESFNLTHGAILGLSHDLRNVLSMRPRNKHPEIDGLWFVGASTHPGTGVPVCLAGARVLGERLVKELGARGEDRKTPGEIYGVVSVLCLAFALLLRFFIWYSVQ